MTQRRFLTRFNCSGSESETSHGYIVRGAPELVSRAITMVAESWQDRTLSVHYYCLFAKSLAIRFEVLKDQLE